MVKTNKDVELIAVPSRTSASTHVVARAGGAGAGFLKLELEPGWKLMRRHYGDRALGHLYVFREVWPGSEPEPAEPAQADTDASADDNKPEAASPAALEP